MSPTPDDIRRMAGTLQDLASWTESGKFTILGLSILATPTGRPAVPYNYGWLVTVCPESDPSRSTRWSCDAGGEWVQVTIRSPFDDDDDEYAALGDVNRP